MLKQTNRKGAHYIMATKTKQMNVEIPESDYNEIKQFAEQNGKTISALMLDAVWALMEYQEDLKDIEEYREEKANGTLVTYSWAKVKKGAGL